MQRIWWLNSTLCAKVHLVTFDLYNYQMPQWPDCRTSKKCSGDIGLSENNSAENSPWGGGEAIASSMSNRQYFVCSVRIILRVRLAKAIRSWFSPLYDVVTVRVADFLGQHQHVHRRAARDQSTHYRWQGSSHSAQQPPENDLSSTGALRLPVERSVCLSSLITNTFPRGRRSSQHGELLLLCLPGYHSYMKIAHRELNGPPAD